MKHILLLSGLLLASLPLKAQQNPAVPLAYSLMNPFTIGMATGAIFTAGTMLWLRARAERLFLWHTVVGHVHINEGRCTVANILEEIEYFANSSQFYGILLTIDVAKGSFGTAAALHREIMLQKKKKPIVAFIENCCCAAGYYIASACDLIVASPCAQMGGIGVLYPHAYLDEPQYSMIEGAGIMQGNWQSDALQAGDYKMADLPMRPMNDHERLMQQNFIDDIYQTMCQDIAQARKLDITTTDIWANGQIFTANYASTIGLVDLLGSLAHVKVAMQQIFLDRKIKVPGRIVFLELASKRWFPTWQQLFEKTVGNQAQSHIRSQGNLN